MPVKLKEVDKVEILTLQDNYIDIAAFDGSEVVQRALSVKDREIKNSILAEHGFSAMVTVAADEMPRSLLFDFGFSEYGAAHNADALDLDLTAVEAMVLSHGHMDHSFGTQVFADTKIIGHNNCKEIMTRSVPGIKRLVTQYRNGVKQMQAQLQKLEKDSEKARITAARSLILL